MRNYLMRKVYVFYQLSNRESNQEKKSRAFHKRPAAGSSHEDKGLANNTHLQVYSSHHFFLAISDSSDSKFVLQISLGGEVCLQNLHKEEIKNRTKFLGWIHTGKKSVL